MIYKRRIQIDQYYELRRKEASGRNKVLPLDTEPHICDHGHSEPEMDKESKQDSARVQ